MSKLLPCCTDRSNIFCHSKICHRVIPSFKLTAIFELEDKETLSVIGNPLMGIHRDCRLPQKPSGLSSSSHKTRGRKKGQNFCVLKTIRDLFLTDLIRPSDGSNPSIGSNRRQNGSVRGTKKAASFEIHFKLSYRSFRFVFFNFVLFKLKSE